MRILTRYLLTELIQVFLIALFCITTTMLLVILVYEAMKNGLSPLAALRIIPYLLPHALCFAIPGTILFSVCSVYGRMSAHNEIVAIKSLGVSPEAVVMPVLILGFLLSLVTVWLNDIAFSWGRRGVFEVVLQSVEQSIYTVLTNDHAYQTEKFSISVKEVENDRLIMPMVVIRDNAAAKPKVIRANYATLTSDPEEGILTVCAFGGQYDDGKLQYTFDQEEIPVSLVDVTRKGSSRRSPSEYALGEIEPELEAEKGRLDEHVENAALRAAFQMGVGDFSHLSGDVWLKEQEERDLMQQRIYRLQAEPWRRFAMGFSCLFFVAVGAPLSIRLRNADVWSSFGLCFLPIVILYYPLLAFGLDRAKSGELPPYVVWLGNIVLGIIGFVVYRKVVRY